MIEILRKYGEAVQTVKSILRRGGRRKTLAPGPEKVDEEWQLSKNSADAATAKRTAADRQTDGRPETDRNIPAAADRPVSRQREGKKQNQDCNKDSLSTEGTENRKKNQKQKI